MIDDGDGALMKKELSIIDLIGSSKLTAKELKKHLDEIRREDS